MITEVVIEQYLNKFAIEYGLADLYEKPGAKIFSLDLDHRSIHLLMTERGFLLHGSVGVLPENDAEPLLLFLLNANYLGQGTGSSTLGLKPDTQTLTLTMPVEYEISYPEFKDVLEEYLNYYDYWIEEILEKTKLCSSPTL
ncbi:MAG: type III secretion system chaperone [Simkaniaceae bacterium]|nr:type III secretion system chaperone [Simkaniaceae bacterium]MCF7851946.1 type III secretion system chaperone [Simkaniaceae bacterium]